MALVPTDMYVLVLRYKHRCNYRQNIVAAPNTLQKKRLQYAYVIDPKLSGTYRCYAGKRSTKIVEQRSECRGISRVCMMVGHGCKSRGLRH
jgi:hypothetical protein